MPHRASRTADAPILGNVPEHRRHDFCGLGVLLVEDLDVPRGRLKVAVAESVLHPREIDTLVDEPRRVRVTDLIWRVTERKPRLVNGRIPDPPPDVRAQVLGRVAPPGR
jgi:hypothetical protein